MASATAQDPVVVSAEDPGTTMVRTVREKTNKGAKNGIKSALDPCLKLLRVKGGFDPMTMT